jgi:arylsulfatase A-like enzyme
MRILYFDIDSLRPDHLGCYGYHRATSPNIDRIAQQGTRFEQCYVSDAPCLPSRTALWSGRFGVHTGVIDHGGIASQPLIEPDRGFRDSFGASSWMSCLRNAGLQTTTISPFGERHAAWHWYAGFNQVINSGGRGLERADQIAPLAIDWLQRNGQPDDWFLHVNLWDPHTPYRTPPDFANPFENDPLPAHITEDYRQRAWEGYGPHSPQELGGFAHGYDWEAQWGVPSQLDSMERVRWWIDHYDMGIRYADEWIGRVLATLDELGILDETVIMISADHGENQGELNVWGDHQTADAITCRVPLIVRWPGITDTARVDSGLHYHFDWAATMIELLGGTVPANWDGAAFTDSFKNGMSAGRDYLVTSQGAWACQRGLRFEAEGDAYLLLRTYHDGYKMLDDLMLFNLSQDPHEQHNLAAERTDLLQQGQALLESWLTEMLYGATPQADPMATVLSQGGALHTRGELPAYLERLRATGRGQHADHLQAKHA